jgi:hypothetical protein
VLLIFNKLADARSLGRCSAVSRRFSALVPLVDDACLRIDRVIPADAADAGAPRPRAALSHLLKSVLLAVLKPFAHCDAKSASPQKHAQQQQQHHSPAQVLRNFSSIRSLRMELPVSDVGTDDGVVLRWKAVFGSTLQSCVILGGTRVDRAAAAGPPHAPSSAPPAGDDDGGSIPESLYTNGGLKLRVVWTISSLIAAATRHYLLREIVKEHPTLERVALTDAGGQGTLSMTDAVGEDGVDEEDEEDGGSSGITQSTRTRTESTRGTSSWKRRETREQQPSALTLPMRLKMTRRSASGRRSNWSSPAAPESQRSSPPRSHRQRRDPAGSSDIGGGRADWI